MFRKNIKLKSNRLLKGSEKKRLISETYKQFPQLTDVEIGLIVPAKEYVTIIKILNNSGIQVNVYSVQKTPVLFELNEKLFPTVYTTWRLPDILYKFITIDAVAKKIINGADLMLPGLVLENDSMESYGNLQKNDIVAINTVDNKAPFAIGRTTMSSYEMYRAGKRGKCVEIFHTYGDKVWSLETSSTLPNMGSLNLREKLRITGINEETGSESPEVVGTPDFNIPKIPCDNDAVQSDDDFSAKDKHDVTEEMDKLLMECFLSCLIKKIDIPILVNVFYKAHMIEACPPGCTLDIKKTKYKKFSKFLDQVTRMGIINVENCTKGVMKISSINWKHELVEDFMKANPKNFEVKLSKQQGPEICEKYVVNAAVLPLFSKFMYKKGDNITGPEIRKTVTAYIKNENLQDPNMKQKVIIDSVISTVLNTKEQSISWEQLMSDIISKMGLCYQIELSNSEVLNAKGKLKPIEIIVATRSGSKKVTMVNNLELYGVNIQEFSRACQHGVAASTTTNIVPGYKSIQVQVQGNQTFFISKLLTERYMIPKRYIRGLFDPSTSKSKQK